jgi:hypothetical protein
MLKNKYRIVTDNRLGYSVEERYWTRWTPIYSYNSFSSSILALEALREYRKVVEFKPQVIYEE